MENDILDDITTFENKFDIKSDSKTSNDLESLNSIVEEFTYLDNGELNRIGKNGRTYLDRECHVENAYSQILKKEKIER